MSIRRTYSLGIALLIMFLACGCFKKVTTNTTVVVKSLVQAESGGTLLPADGVVMYAYYTGSEEWEIRSYEDALNRVITNTTTNEQRTMPDVEGAPYAIEGSANCYTSFFQSASPAMVVVVYPAAKMYAYMFRSLVAENLPTTYLTLIFRPWKSEPYFEGSKAGYKWYVVPPATPDEGEGGTDGSEGTTDNGSDDTNSSGDTADNTPTDDSAADATSNEANE